MLSSEKCATFCVEVWDPPHPQQKGTYEILLKFYEENNRKAYTPETELLRLYGRPQKAGKWKGLTYNNGSVPPGVCIFSNWWDETGQLRLDLHFIVTKETLAAGGPEFDEFRKLMARPIPEILDVLQPFFEQEVTRFVAAEEAAKNGGKQGGAIAQKSEPSQPPKPFGATSVKHQADDWPWWLAAVAAALGLGFVVYKVLARRE